MKPLSAKPHPRPSLRLALFTSALTVSFAGLSTGQAQHTHAGHPPMTMQDMNVRDLATLKPLRDQAFDTKFAQLMIDHHQMALDMANLVLKQGRNTTVKAAAKQVVIAQQKEINLMQSWLHKWTGKTHPPQRASMTVTGNADRWFLTEMIPHHQGAVQMAKLVPVRTKNAAVRQLALEIIQAQESEINQYRLWLKTVK